MTLQDPYTENRTLRRELRAAKGWIYFFAFCALLAYGYIFYDFARQCYPEAF